MLPIHQGGAPDTKENATVPIDQATGPTVKQEIERKFLVDRLPENLDSYPSKRIVQGYLAVMENGNEVRLRQKGDKYFLTVKSDGDAVRSEPESSITREQFDALWPGVMGTPIIKTRYEIPFDGATLELDIYHGELEGLMTVEVESDSIHESEAFTPPDWVGTEVTKDRRYKNKNLALHGLP